MKPLSVIAVLHYFTLHLLQILLINYSSEFLWTDEVNPLLGWSWSCIERTNFKLAEMLKAYWTLQLIS